MEEILLYATHLGAALVAAITASTASVVVIGQDGSLFNIPSIIYDNLSVGFSAEERLVAVGAGNIGFIGVSS